MYFENFPLINYSLDGGTTNFVSTDIFRRVVARTNNIFTSTAYDKYDILDGDTPEIVADKVYGNVELYWIILIANEILDPRYDWPLPQNALQAYITDKYGAGNEFDTHHWENEQGDIVHSSYAGIKYEYTNTDFEQQENEAKRQISILKPQFIQQFVQNFNGLLKDGD